MVDAACAANPGVSVDREAFLQHLTAHSEATPLECLHVNDLHLAFACAGGNAEALREFDRRYHGEIPGALSRLRSSRTTIDEVSQMVREKLFVAPPGGRPKIAEYAGRGALLSWLRAVAVRTALSHRRREGLEPQLHDDGEPLLAVAGATEDPELEHIRARYAEPFKTAFHDALRALTPQDRNVLRLHVVDGLNIDQVGAVYGVHRATVARWIAQSREALVEKTRALLSERLRLDTQEFESLTRLCRSRLDLSMGRVLGE